MGIIDKLSITLTCSRCGATEESSILDTGSRWSSSNWSCPRPFTQFDVIYKGGGKDEPSVDSAQCKVCGNAASVKTTY